jgi:hypothetical protein
VISATTALKRTAAQRVTCRLVLFSVLPLPMLEKISAEIKADKHGLLMIPLL